MNEQKNNEPNQELKDEMTLHKLRQLIYWSFEYSQGQEKFQVSLLNYFVKAHPGLKWDLNLLDRIKDEINNMGALFEMAKMRTQKLEHAKVNNEGIIDSLLSQTNSLRIAIEQNQKSPIAITEETIVYLFENFLSRDHIFMIQRRKDRKSSLLTLPDSKAYTHPFFRELGKKIEEGIVKTPTIFLKWNFIMRQLSEVTYAHIRNGGNVPTYIKSAVDDYMQYINSDEFFKDLQAGKPRYASTSD